MKKLNITLLLIGLTVWTAGAQSSLLWKIEKEGRKDSYLFGTFHVFPKEQFRIEKRVKDAFEKTDQLVMELDMSPSSQTGMMQLANMPDGKRLEDFLDNNELIKLDSALAAVGMSRALFNKWRPFLISSLFYASYMPNGIASFEMTFYGMAKDAGKPVIGLESVERQLRVFDEIPYEDQAKDLMEIVADYKKNKELFDKMVEVYQSENLEQMLKMSGKEFNNEREMDLLINDRNTEWMPLMENLMKRSSSFFAVGAGHLGGPNGVIALLKEKGYKLTPIFK